MNIEFVQEKAPEQTAPNAPIPPQSQRGRVVVSLSPKRERVMLDINGNQIDPRTKQIIKLAKDVI